MRSDNRLTCSETLLRLDDYLDRSLWPEEIGLVEAHLQDCIACAAQFRFETTLVTAIRDRLRRIALPPALLENVLRALRTEASSG
jgi:anti-sigma factor RsiW